MKRSHSFFPFIVGFMLLAASVAVAQETERLQIDDKIVTVVRSPWKLMDIDTTASLRGLHVLSPTDVWASGTGGTIINTIDGGETWRVKVVPGAEKLDFRDIHAIDDGTIVAMTSGSPARIYRSTNGGSSWKLCFESTNPKVFLDSISFFDQQHGIVMGDPLGDALLLLRTLDSGKTWQSIKKVPTVSAGEAGFAASGTNMVIFDGQTVAIALGGAAPNKTQPTSRVLMSSDSGATWKVGIAKIARSPSSGIFSLCFANNKDGVAVGGDFKQPNNTADNYAITRDGGKTWSTPRTRQPPTGYRSCVATWVDGKEVHFIAVGPNGTDRSGDLGQKWKRISNKGFHAIDFSPDGKHGWAVGANGRVAKWLGIKTTGRKQ